MFLRLLVQDMRRADSRAAWTAGSNKATSTPIMAITTKSSTSVKAGRVERFLVDRKAAEINMMGILIF